VKPNGHLETQPVLRVVRTVRSVVQIMCTVHSVHSVRQTTTSSTTKEQAALRVVWDVPPVQQMKGVLSVWRSHLSAQE